MTEIKDKLPEFLNRNNHRGGEIVPDDYFSTFSSRMQSMLPEREWESESQITNRSFWQKVRPYVYLAAMFLGIWCMMNLFDLIRSDSSLSISDNPTLLAAINNDTFVSDYIIDDMTTSDLYEDLYESGFDPDNMNGLTDTAD